jgi:hypothetical protein
VNLIKVYYMQVVSVIMKPVCIIYANKNFKKTIVHT